MTASEMAVIAGALPKHCQITSVLGKGGQGAVFGGEYSGVPAAIKLFKPTTDESRVGREIDALKGISHPHLVRILGSESIMLGGDRVSVVAYELLNGVDLRAQVASGRIFSEDDLRQIGREIGGAIEALWEERIVHRDVKPENVVSELGRYVLVDIGLARHVDKSTLTAAGLAPGTPGYMSPEQWLGRHNLSIHSDCFGLGVMLYELAVGCLPFGRDNLAGALKTVSLVSAIRKDLSAEFGQSVGRLLQARSFKRPVNLTALFCKT